MEKINNLDINSDNGVLTIFIAVNGDDSWSGLHPDPSAGLDDGPLATLQAAKEKLKLLNGNKNGKGRDTVIYMRGGTYHIRNTVVFSADDWPYTDKTLTIAAYGDEKPVISSGILINSWRRPENSIDCELPENLRDCVWLADVPPELAGRKFYSMYKGVEKLKRAQSKGFTPTNELTREERKNHAILGNLTERCNLHYPAGSIEYQDNLEDMEIFIMPSYKFMVNLLPLKSIDERACIVTTAIPGTYPLKKISKTRNDEFTCWVQNSVKYLSGPNEWVLDSKQKKIYYWPENGKPSNDIFAPCLREFILLEGNVGKKIPVKNITIKGLIFIQGDRDEWTSSDRRLQHDWDMLDKANAMLRLRWAENCTIVGCRFENSSSSAIRLDLYSQHNCVDGNEITHIGGTGILLCGYGPGTVDLNNCNQIKGNHIRHCGEEFWHAPAIFIWQSGSNLVSGNLIHNMPYIGIVISGMRECYETIRWDEIREKTYSFETWEAFIPYLHSKNNIVENNELYAVMEKLGDGNAIYVSGAGDGNIIRRNYIHHCEECEMVSAIRTDDFQRETQITGNIIYKCCGGGIILKHKNYIEENIIADMQPVTNPDGTKTPARGYICLRRGPSAGSRVRRNILYNTSAAVPFYDEGAGMVVEWIRNCETDYNQYWCVPDPRIAEDMIARNRSDGIDQHSVCADPMFKNPVNGDFSIGNRKIP